MSLVHDLPSLSVTLGDPHLVAGILASTDAVASGHFGLLGGLHSDSFIRFSRVAAQPRALDATTRWLLPSVAAWVPDVVVAPVTAGVALGACLATRLGLPLALVDVDEDGCARALLAPEQIEGRRALLVNDVVTTGERMVALANATREGGARVAGACWFLSRGNADVGDMIDSATAAIGTLRLSQWSAESCPLCGHGEPLTLAVEIN